MAMLRTKAFWRGLSLAMLLVGGGGVYLGAHEHAHTVAVDQFNISIVMAAITVLLIEINVS